MHQQTIKAQLLIADLCADNHGYEKEHQQTDDHQTGHQTEYSMLDAPQEARVRPQHHAWVIRDRTVKRVSRGGCIACATAVVRLDDTVLASEWSKVG